MGLVSLSPFRRDPGRGEDSRRIAARGRAHLRLAEDEAGTVSEIAGGDPECGGGETIVLVMRAGRRTEATKIRKSMALVEPDDVVAAFSESAGQG